MLKLGNMAFPLNYTKSSEKNNKQEKFKIKNDKQEDSIFQSKPSYSFQKRVA